MKYSYSKVSQKRKSRSPKKKRWAISVLVVLVLVLGLSLLYKYTRPRRASASSSFLDAVDARMRELGESERNTRRLLDYALDELPLDSDHSNTSARPSLHWTSADFGSVNIDHNWPPAFDYYGSGTAELSVTQGFDRPEFVAPAANSKDSVYDMEVVKDGLRLSQYSVESEISVLHLAMSFDAADVPALNRTLASIRAFTHVNNHSVHLHMIGPEDQLPLLANADLSMSTYKLETCASLLAPFKGLIDPVESPARACKLVLHEILPANLTFVLSIDPGMMFVSHGFSQCWRAPKDEFVMFQAGISGAFSCQMNPKACSPSPFKAACVVSDSLSIKCPGTAVDENNFANFSRSYPYAERRLGRLQDMSQYRIHAVGDMQLSPSVMGLALGAMRASKDYLVKIKEASVRMASFTGRYYLTTAQIFNNYVRLFPLSHSLLPCECLHEVSWPRPDLVCPNKELLILNPTNSIDPEFPSQLVRILDGYNRSKAVDWENLETPLSPVFATILRRSTAELLFERQTECSSSKGDCNGKKFWSGAVPEISSLVKQLSQVDSAAMSGNETKFPTDSSSSVGPVPNSVNSEVHKKIDANFKPLVDFNTSSTAVSVSAANASLNTLDLPKVTVVIQSYNADGYRPLWLISSLKNYVSPEFKHLVDRVILVWNNPVVPAPHVPEGVTALSMKQNSLNNRWVKTLPYINTEAVLNLDDDMFVDLNGVECMLRTWLAQPGQDRMVGPFARFTNNGKMYSMSEIFEGGRYEVILPRTVVLHRRYIENYASVMPEQIRQYVDDQEAHCDDIALTMATTNMTGKPPLRVLLPKSSIIDYFDCANGDRNNTGGLALQHSRSQLRAQCVAELHKSFNNFPLHATDEIATCTPNRFKNVTVQKVGPKITKVHPQSFLQMKIKVNCSSFH